MSQTAVDRLSSLRSLGAQLGLERMERALVALDAPHRAFASVHIAGTNGKGSTAAMVACALRLAGYRVGLYTSPHLCQFTERIQVDGVEISDDELEAAIDTVLGLGIELTFFEAATVVAFAHFRSSAVQIAVVETGLGGRLDATNVITPSVSVITSIDLDHTEVLGCDLVSIAHEKAGIIKAGAPLVTISHPDEVDAVLQRQCEALQAPLWRLGREVHVDIDQQTQQRFYRGPSGRIGPLALALQGDHQWQNAGLALAALEQLDACGWPSSFSQRLRALSEVRWPGRLERIGRFVLDCAHNPAGARALAATLGREQVPTLIFGAMQDKDAGAMLEALLPRVGRVIFTRAPTERARFPGELAPLCDRAEVAEDVASALALVAGDPGPIVITGSAYVVGAVRRLLLGQPTDADGLADPAVV